MSGRFPGAKTVDAFWSNLVNGVESLRTFRDEELAEAGVPASLFEDPRYVRKRPVVDDVDGKSDAIVAKLSRCRQTLERSFPVAPRQDHEKPGNE